ncbi:glycosyltransferase family 2 protein [Pseudomonadales bacterium]|nr:glycosyltransferase family 2 protein [Pseudomonadales bacterium]
MFFSVVIALYNKDAFIKKTLNSVLKQTHTDFEVIIVDDGSTDDSVQIVNRFSDDRIKLYQQLNQGVSVARNVGVEKSGNNHIALLDADDEWLPNHLENLLHLVQTYPDASFWVSGYRKSFQTAKLSEKPIQKICLETYLDYRLDNTSIAWTSAVLLNKGIFNKTNGFMPGVSHGEDQALWLEMCLHGFIGKSFLETAIYNIYDNSLSSKLVTCEKEDACILTVKKILYENRGVSDQIKLKLMDFSNRYRLAHIVAALSLQQPSIAKRFLNLSHDTKIYRNRRRLLFMLWLVSLVTPYLVARIINAKSGRK